MNFEDAVPEEKVEERQRETYGKFLLNDADIEEGHTSSDSCCLV